MPRVAWSANDAAPARMPFDFPDLIAALAPRAFLAVAPQQDDNFAVDGVRETMALVEPIYRRAGAAERLAARCGGSAKNGQMQSGSRILTETGDVNGDADSRRGQPIFGFHGGTGYSQDPGAEG